MCTFVCEETAVCALMRHHFLVGTLESGPKWLLNENIRTKTLGFTLMVQM